MSTLSLIPVEFMNLMTIRPDNISFAYKVSRIFL